MSKSQKSWYVSFSRTDAIVIIILLIWLFFTRALAGFPQESEWKQVPQIPWTLLCMLVDLNNAVVWTVSTCRLISRSSTPYTIHVVTLPRALITVSITVTLMCHSFSSVLARSRYWYLISLSLNFTQSSAGTAKSSIQQVLFFGGGLNIITLSFCRLWLICL